MNYKIIIFIFIIILLIITLFKIINNNIILHFLESRINIDDEAFTKKKLCTYKRL